MTAISQWQNNCPLFPTSKSSVDSNCAKHWPIHTSDNPCPIHYTYCHQRRKSRACTHSSGTKTHRAMNSFSIRNVWFGWLSNMHWACCHSKRSKWIRRKVSRIRVAKWPAIGYAVCPYCERAKQWSRQFVMCARTLPSGRFLSRRIRVLASRRWVTLLLGWFYVFLGWPNEIPSVSCTT